MLSTAFAQLDVSIYDPLAVRAPSGDHLYDEDYAEISHDPDPGYWAEVDLKMTTPHRIGARVPAGAQVVNEIEYIFFEVTPGTDVSELYNAIASGNASIPPDRLNGGTLDGYATLAVVIVVPAALVQRYSAGYQPREHLRLFTAFADDQEVLYHQQWSPNDAGACATVISLRAIPKRMKTLISTRFAHRG